MKMVQVHMHTCEHRWTLSCHDNHLEDGVPLKEFALLEPSDLLWKLWWSGRPPAWTYLCG